ncbi:hypothetical protein HDU76_008134 [Blyttiomyces sp. JEL0837]|nr:hypothetical protein HDU76_008134 [Blyttiomyces sp. JEL0837]
MVAYLRGIRQLREGLSRGESSVEEEEERGGWVSELGNMIVLGRIGHRSGNGGNAGARGNGNHGVVTTTSTAVGNELNDDELVRRAGGDPELPVYIGELETGDTGHGDHQHDDKDDSNPPGYLQAV